MLVRQFLKRAWPWSQTRLEDMPDYDSRLSEIGRIVLFPLHVRVLEKVHRAGVSRLVSGARYSLVRALAAILSSVLFCHSRPDVVGWYSYNFTMGDVYPVRAHRSKQGKESHGLSRVLNMARRNATV